MNKELREPPLLSEEELVEAIKQDDGEFTRKKDWWHTYALTAYYKIVAQAQKEADIKWMKENCYLIAKREFPPNPWQPAPYSPYYRQFEKYKKDILKKVKGVAYRACRKFGE